MQEDIFLKEKETVRVRYHNILHDNMTNGDGLRVVLFVSGCDHHCKGCQNPITWDPNDGLIFGIKEMFEIFDQLKQPHISGITLSGGDPLYPDNRPMITNICYILKLLLPDKTIWCYTGYLFEQIKDLPVMQYIDVLVDGPFVQELADVQYRWAGSTNQRIWRKVNGEWRVDDEDNRLERGSTETSKCSRDS